MLIERAKVGVLGVVATTAIAWVNIVAALYVGLNRCGDESHPEPEPGSPLSGYCDFFSDPDDRVTFFTGLLIYAPVLITLGGVVWGIARGDWRPLVRSILIAFAWLLVVVVPAVILPAS
jgi:hypothetical protein